MEHILQKMTSLVAAVLFLTTGLIHCDTSQTIKGVHKHTFLIYTETRNKKNGNAFPSSGTSSSGIGNIGWPNTEFGNTKWPFTESDNAKQLQSDFDGWKWSDKGSSPLEWSDMGSLNLNKQGGQTGNINSFGQNNKEPLEWSDMGSLNLNKQGGQTGNINSFGQNNKQTEEFDAMKKLRLGMDNGGQVTTPNKISPAINGIKNLRPIVDSVDRKKVLTGVGESPQDENDSGEDEESEEDSDQQNNSNTQGQEEKNKEQAISVRNIKAKPGYTSPKLCPEDVMYLEHMLGMRPMQYKPMEMGTFGNQQSRRGRKQSLSSGIKGSDTRNIRSRNKIRVTRRPLIQKLRALSFFGNSDH